jgi:hypothetical protein
MRLLFRHLPFVFVCLMGLSWPASAQQGVPRIASDNCLFTEGDLARLELPPQAQGRWILLDAAGKQLRYGQLADGERVLYFGGLKNGIYYLFWWNRQDGAPDLDTQTPDRLSFLLLPKPPDPPGDPFFAVNQPGLAADLKAGRNTPDSDYTFTLNALARLGIRRLRTRLTQADLCEPSKPGEINWRTFDQLTNDTTARNIRLIALLGGASSPQTSNPAGNAQLPDAQQTAAYLQALLMRDALKTDEFALWNEPNGPSFPGDAAAFRSFAQTGYDTVKIRSRRATVALGGIAPVSTQPTFLPDLFKSPEATFLDVLDFRADGTLADAKKFNALLDQLTRNTPFALKPRAVSHAAFPCANNSIRYERLQASETLKKLIWARYHNFHYFTAANLLDPPDDKTGNGLFARTTAGPDPGQPRLQAFAWVTALQRLSNAQPTENWAFEGPTLEVYSFSRQKETLLAAWIPQNRRAGGKRAVASFHWPEGAQAELYDLTGERVTSQRLKSHTGGWNYVLLDIEPLYIVVPAPAAEVTW